MEPLHDEDLLIEALSIKTRALPLLTGTFLSRSKLFLLRASVSVFSVSDSSSLSVDSCSGFPLLLLSCVCSGRFDWEC